MLISDNEFFFFSNEIKRDRIGVFMEFTFLYKLTIGKVKSVDKVDLNQCKLDPDSGYSIESKILLFSQESLRK